MDILIPLNKFAHIRKDQRLLLEHIHCQMVKFMIFKRVLPINLRGAFVYNRYNWHCGLQNATQALRNMAYATYIKRAFIVTVTLNFRILTSPPPYVTLCHGK